MPPARRSPGRRTGATREASVILYDYARYACRFTMPLITVRAAAERLGVSYSTFKQWIYKGAVRTVQTSGGHHRIDESEIDRLLAASRRRPPAVRGRRKPPGVLVALSGRNQLRGMVEEIRV